MHRLEVVSIANEGNLANECVWFKAAEDIPRLHDYIVTDTTYTDDQHISNELRHVFWFPSIAVKKGDYVKLMTKVGQRSTVPNNQGTTTHVLYWGLGRTVWNRDGDCAVVFNVETWKTKRSA